MSAPARIGPLVLLLAGVAACGGVDRETFQASYFELTGADVFVERRGDDLVAHLAEPARDVVVRLVGEEGAAGGEPIARLEAGRRLRLEGLGEAPRPRLRVEAEGLAPRVVAERGVPLEGASNFRDLGGYETADGRRVRWGRVYRSDALDELTEADRARLEAIGLRLVCDLRSEAEVAAHPGRPPASAEVVHLPILADAVRPERLRERIEEGDLEGLDADFMARAYRAMLDEHAEPFGRALARLARPDALPAVVSGTAGKDRTGIAAALLLRALGVPEETVLGDYRLSELYAWRDIRRTSFFLLLRGIEPKSLRPLIGVDVEVLRAALRHLDATYGGVEPYLLGPAGLPPAALAALRTTLLD